MKFIRVIKASSEYDTMEQEVFQAMLDAGYDKEEAEQKMKYNNYVYLEGQTEEDLGREFVYMLGSINEVAGKKKYFDFDSYLDNLCNEMDVAEAEAYVDELKADEEMISDELLERYFNYKQLGEDLSYDWIQTDNGWVMID